MRNSQQAGCYFHFDNVFQPHESVFGNIILHQTGELWCESGYEIKPHRQWCHEFSYIVSGQGVFIHDDQRLQVAAGDIIYSSDACLHAIEAGNHSPLRFVYVGFTFIEQPEAAFSEIEAWLRRASCHYARKAFHLLPPFNRCMDELFSRPYFFRQMIRNQLENIIISAYRVLMESTSQSISASMSAIPAKYRAQKSPDAVGHAVYSAIRYVEQHICELKQTRTVTDALGYSYTYLSRLFKQRTGMTLQRYISHKKIEKACELFGYGNMSVQEVAHTLHYETVQSFSKAFSRTMGFPPSQLKSRHFSR